MAIETFTRDDFESVLRDANLNYDSLGLIGQELCYAVILDKQSSIRIRSSIRPDGASAKVGEDSIRAYLLGPDAQPLVAKSVTGQERWIARTPGWQARLIATIEKLRVFRQALGNCAKCGAPRMALVSRTAKNPGRVFTKCSKCGEWGAWLNVECIERQESMFVLATQIASTVAQTQALEKFAETRETSAPVADNGLAFLADVAELPEEPAPVAVKPFTPSPYQEAIRDFVLQSSQALRVEAYAGSGKTSTNAFVCRALPENSAKVKMMVFSKANQLDMQAKIPDWIPATTTHSAGFADIRRVYKNVRVDERKTLDMFKEYFKHDYTMREFYPQVAKLVSLCKNTLSRADDEILDELCNRYDVQINGSRTEIYDAVGDILRDSADNTSVIDFDDMLWMPASGKVPVEKCDLLFVDEYQDNNAAQEAYYLKTQARIVFVGDEHQCHPSDTLISVTGGTKKEIQDVKVGDRVVSYYTQESIFRGVKNQGRKVLETAKRFYNGDLIHLCTDWERVKVTPEHRCLLRMKPGTSYAMYLMIRDNQARIGITRTSHRSESGLAMRARQEKAERAWILAMYDSLDEARISELATQAKYGLPSLIFESTQQIENMQQPFIDSVYARIGNNISKAIQCLEDFGRDYKYPLWKNNVPNCHFGTKSFVTQACNVVSGYMTVRTFDGTDRGGNWDVVYATRERYEGLVYSLSVEPTEGGKKLYVANNIVVHNSIYGFRGAMIGAMDKMQKQLGAQQLPLPISYRCARSIIALAQTIVPEIQPRPDAPDGLVADVPSLNGVQPGDMVLCRNNAPLVRSCFELIRNGIKATIKGRDIGTNLMNLVKRVEKKQYSFSFNALLISIQDYTDSESAKLDMQHKESQAASLRDQCETIMALSEDCHSVSDLEKKVKSIFRDDVEGVMLSTGHKAKGLESNNVYILQPELLQPQRYDTRDWQLEQLRNLTYVMYTRARENLRFVRG